MCESACSLWEYQWARNQTCEIYHLLRATFGQGIAVAQIVHFDVFDKVAILLINVALLPRW